METTNSDIEKIFINKLHEFAAQGYTFGNGLELRKGTKDNPNAHGTQRESFDAYIKGLETGHRHGYDEVPTGVGKTAGFLARIKCYLQAKEETGSDKRVLIVVPSTDLVVQTSKAIAKFMPDLAPTIEADDDQGKEIDWENSQIGVQYGTQKHAHKKPNILITTYQSLIRDEENIKYPPNEYGFVIYDEGHNITAPRFGEGVDKFKDSIQLAVTATPEYSESKAVSNKLAYRYYHLPLAETIKRGDLCDVDPILIKTNFTIDEAKAKEFLEASGGRPLTKSQMEKLLNQESRNLAAIKTYLLGADVQTGERYFGQLGMVFAGGVAHTEDFCRQFESVLQKPEYKPIRDLLVADGIAPVAYIHSKTPKAGIPLTIDGNKRNYTEDEIKELHRRGKILLLVSDGKLKLGSDFPRDSIEMDLVDRLSVVDATQRFGRGFRLDTPDPDNNHPGDPEKRCKAFNLVDENTFDLYKHTPQMLPIYAAEILAGAEFREPQKRKHLINRFSKKIPDVDDSLELSGFEVITNIDQVREVSNKYKKRKEQLDLPKKTDDWLSPTGDIQKQMGGGAVQIKDSSNQICSLYDNKLSGIQTVTYDQTKFRLQRMKVGPVSPVCIARNDWENYCNDRGYGLGDNLPLKNEEWLSGLDTRNLYGGRFTDIKYAVKEILSKYDTKMGGKQQVSYNGQNFNLQLMRSKTQKVVCLKRDDWDKVAIAVGRGIIKELPKRTNDWLTSIGGAISMPGGGKSGIEEVINNLVSQYDDEIAGLQYAETEKGDKVALQKLDSHGKHCICFARKDWDKIAKAAGYDVIHELPSKSHDWVTIFESRGLPGGGVGEIQSAIQHIISQYDQQKSGIQSIKINEQSIKVQQLQSGAQQPVCIHREDWYKLFIATGQTALLDMPHKSNDWLNMTNDLHGLPQSRSKVVGQLLKELKNTYNESVGGIQTTEINGQYIRLQQMQSGPKRPICIAKDDWESVLKAANIQKSESRKIEPKSIKPDSDHITNRSGRSID